MENIKVLENLCYYDRRNPYFSIKEEYGYDKEEVDATGNFAKPGCGCDNCFYGRAKLSEFILKQQEEMYSEFQVHQIIELIRITGESPEFVMKKVKK